MGTTVSNIALLEALDPEAQAALLAAFEDMQGTDLDLTAEEPELTPEPAPVETPEEPEVDEEDDAPVAPPVTEKLTLTKRQRQTLEGLFVAGPGVLLKRVKALLQYHRWTTDQLIAAMHESADAEGVPLNITKGERSTIARAMAVVKAWYASKAYDIVGEKHPSRDAALQNLAQIANITPAGIENYEIPEGERVDGIRYRTVTIHPRGKEDFEPFPVEIPYGTGEKAMADIVNAYLGERLQGESEGDDWLATYRRAVVYANNEKRRATQAHDTAAADARVGGGSSTGGARNPGGKTDEVEPETVPVKDNRTPGEKTLTEATLGELLRAVTMRISDYSVPITVADTQAWTAMEEHYEVRFEKVPVGTTVTRPSAKQVEVTQTAVAVDAQYQINLAPAPVGPADALLRAIMAELQARPTMAPEVLTLVGAGA